MLIGDFLVPRHTSGKFFMKIPLLKLLTHIQINKPKKCWVSEGINNNLMNMHEQYSALQKYSNYCFCLALHERLIRAVG